VLLEAGGDGGLAGAGEGGELAAGGGGARGLAAGGELLEAELALEVAQDGLAALPLEAVFDAVAVVVDAAGDDVEVVVLGVTVADGDPGTVAVAEAIEVGLGKGGPELGRHLVDRCGREAGMEDGLADPLVEGSPVGELARQAAGVLAAHVAGDDLGVLVVVEGVVENAAESPSGLTDLLDHGRGAPRAGRRAGGGAARAVEAARRRLGPHV
jgi:hypothetical protein